MRQLSIVFVAAFLAACGGAPASQSTPTSQPTGTPTVVNLGRITLTQDTCITDIAAPAPPGRIAITVVNQRAVDASFTMYRIAEGHTFAEAKNHADAERHLADTGQPFMGPGAYFEDPGPMNQPVLAGATSTLERTALRGTYAVTCFAFDARSRGQRVVAAVGPIEIK